MDNTYRIASGADWVALIGDDSDFTPIVPWAKHNGNVASGTRSPARSGACRRRRNSGTTMSAALSMRCAAFCTSSACAGICRANWVKPCDHRRPSLYRKWMKPCHSNEDLFQETVRYVRAQFDIAEQIAARIPIDAVKEARKSR